MRVDVDIKQLREVIALWQYTLVLRDSVTARDRDRLLDRIACTVAAWRNLLSVCSGEGSDELELLALRREILDLQEWAEEAAYALTILNDEQA